MLSDAEKDQIMSQYEPKKTILVSMFRYTMTFPTFYLVLKKTKRTITIIKLQTQNVTDDGYGQAGTCVPIMQTAVGEKSINRRMLKNGLFKSSNYSDYLKIWDGKPVEFDTYD